MCVFVSFLFFFFCLFVFLHVGKNDEVRLRGTCFFTPFEASETGADDSASQLLLHPTTGMSLPERSFHLYPSTSGVSQVFGNCAD